MRDGNLLNEDLVPLGEARRHLVPRKGNKPVSPSTVWRWVHKGIRGPGGTRIRLEVVYAGGVPCTSREALHHFFSRVTEARLAQVDDADESAERSEATESRLREAGLLSN